MPEAINATIPAIAEREDALDRSTFGSAAADRGLLE
jgi:hypothetical protein